MKALIVDDERKGREVLQKMIENYCEDVNIVAMASGADEGYELITRHSPDIVFLDIEMPNGSGFDLLEKFDDIRFRVIFTTAHDDYALKAIKFHALDYLLKPVDIDELRTAVALARKNIGTPQVQNPYTDFLARRKVKLSGRISLYVKDGIVYVAVNDIIRIESDGAYSTICMADGGKHIVSRNLKEYEMLLPEEHFFRVHKSHIVNMKRVKKYLRSDGFFVEMEDGSMVEIARRKKDEFLEKMNALE